jgi:hypothetical protein
MLSPYIADEMAVWAQLWLHFCNVSEGAQRSGRVVNNSSTGCANTAVVQQGATAIEQICSHDADFQN